MKRETKSVLIKTGVSALVVIAFLGLGYLGMVLLGWHDISRAEMQKFIAEQGALAPVIYLGVGFLQTTFVPIPAMLTILAGCYVFGIWEAFFYSYISSLVGAMVAFWLGKTLGKRFVNFLSGGEEQTEKWLKKLKGREHILLFFMFLLPFFPDDILCAVAGVLPISWGAFFLMQVFTRATSIGGTILFTSGEIIPFEGWGLGLLCAIAVVGVALFILCLLKADKINGWIDKVFKRKHDGQ